MRKVKETIIREYEEKKPKGRPRKAIRKSSVPPKKSDTSSDECFSSSSISASASSTSKFEPVNISDCVNGVAEQYNEEIKNDTDKVPITPEQIDASTESINLLATYAITTEKNDDKMNNSKKKPCIIHLHGDLQGGKSGTINLLNLSVTKQKYGTPSVHQQRIMEITSLESASVLIMISSVELRNQTANRCGDVLVGHLNDVMKLTEIFDKIVHYQKTCKLGEAISKTLQEIFPKHGSDFYKYKTWIDDLLNPKSLLIIDEAHADSQEDQTAKKFFTNLILQVPNKRIILVSATWYSAMIAGIPTIKLENSPKYVGYKEFKKRGMVVNADESTDKEHIKELKKIMKDLGWTTRFYMIIRVTKKNKDEVVKTFRRVFGKEIEIVTDYMKDTEDINKRLLEKEPQKITLILIKNKHRAGKTLHLQYVALSHETRSTKHQHVDSVAQGLLSRGAGTRPYETRTLFACNIEAYDTHYKFWDSVFDQNIKREDVPKPKYIGDMDTSGNIKEGSVANFLSKICWRPK